MASAPLGLIPAGTVASDIEIDLLIVGAGTGMAAALAASELGLSVLVVEKSHHVGGSTARSGEPSGYRPARSCGPRERVTPWSGRVPTYGRWSRAARRTRAVTASWSMRRRPSTC